MNKEDGGDNEMQIMESTSEVTTTGPTNDELPRSARTNRETTVDRRKRKTRKGKRRRSREERMRKKDTVTMKIRPHTIDPIVSLWERSLRAGEDTRTITATDGGQVPKRLVAVSHQATSSVWVVVT